MLDCHGLVHGPSGALVSADEQAREEAEALAADDAEFARQADAIDVASVEIPVDPAEAQPFVPEPGEMVPVEPGLDVFRRMELEDERAIMEELQGRALSVMLYDFESGGKRQLGFSWTGIAEGVNTLNRRGLTRIRISPEFEPRFEEIEMNGKRYVRCTVYAEDRAHGSGNYGVAENGLKIQKRNGGEVADPFAHRKALSKAQRNAFEPLIPLELREYLKAQYQGAGKVQTIAGAESAVPDRPPPLDDDRAKEQLARLREIYDDVKAVNRLVMPPGQFNAIVMGAQHDHDRLDDAIAHLEAFRDGEEEIRSMFGRLTSLVGKEEADKVAAKLVGMDQARRKAAITNAVEAAEGGDDGGE